MLVDDVGFGSVWRVERYLEMDSEQVRRNVYGEDAVLAQGRLNPRF
jgi:hypothetical protein